MRSINPVPDPAARFLPTENKITLRFWQEIYDEAGKLVEIHDKYPTDTGHYLIEP